MNSTGVRMVETYFKRGARIKPALRRQLTEAIVVNQPVRPKGQAYTFAMANIHKPWARRWIKLNGYFL